MSYTIPQKGSAPEAAHGFLAVPQQTDFDVLAAGFAGIGVRSGCAVSQRAAGANRSVDVAAGVLNNGVAVAGGNSAVGANATGTPRIDIVTADLTTGAITVTAGAAAATPQAPAIPANGVLLAFVAVENNATTIATATEIVDKRAIIADWSSAGMFGDGSDGNVTISTTVTLTADKFYDTLTVQSGGTLNTGGWRVFCRTKCDIQTGGIIQNKGNNATGLTGGTPAASWQGGAAEVSGANGTSAASGGFTASGTSGATHAFFGSVGGPGGASGQGQAGGNSTISGSLPAAPWHTVVFWALAQPGGVATNLRGGMGGGGGGNSAGTSGGGGGAGGILLLFARELVVNGTLTVAGGNGANATGTNSGGGGGGGGGLLAVLYSIKRGTNSALTAAVNAPGGTGGTAVGTGVAGTAGTNGTVVAVAA